MTVSCWYDLPSSESFQTFITYCQLEHALVFISRLDGGPLATKLQDKVVELRAS